MITTEQVEAARRERLVPLVARRVKLARKGGAHWGLCPFHKETDPSFKVEDAFFKCFACDAKGDVIAWVMKTENVPFHAAVQILAGGTVATAATSEIPQSEPPTEHKEDRAAKARALWSRRLPIDGTPAETYLRIKRGYPGPIPPTLGYLPAWKPGHRPAMIARFGRGELGGVHLTLLREDGSDKADVEKPKRMLGVCKGSPIILAPVNNLLGLAITEGIEDGLSVYESTGLGVWAAGSAGFMQALADVVPGYVEAVSVYAHSDDAGQRGARGFAGRLQQRGNVDTAILNLEGGAP